MPMRTEVAHRAGPSAVAVAPPVTASGRDVSIVLRPRCLLTHASALRLLAVTCAITFAAALLAAAQGAWPALPFAALEMAVLYFALRLSLARGRDFERIEISEDSVRVVARVGARTNETRFRRHWARVRLQAAESTLHPHRLLIECQGRCCELGAFLTEQERADVAGRLKRLIGRVGESPELTGG